MILSDGTDGPIKCIKWRGRFAAWTSKRGVVVFDVVQERTISIIKLDANSFNNSSRGNEPNLVCRLSWSDQTTLFVSFGDSVRVCNITRRDINEAKAKDLPQFLVEITHTLKLDCNWICGIAPMDKLLVLLTKPKVLSEEDEEENQPQLTIIDPLEDDYTEVSTDFLCLKDYDNYVASDLHLEYLIEDKHYFIVSPRDIFFGKPRDADDHVDWLLMQEQVRSRPGLG
jgi:hypothetical protein